jgi:hypothetical protein
MNEWPADHDLDEELRKLIGAEVGRTDSREIRLQPRTRRGRAAGAALATLAVVAIVGSLVLRAQLAPGAGDDAANPSDTTSLTPTEQPTTAPTVAPTATPTGIPEPSLDTTPVPMPEGSFKPGTTMACVRDRNVSVTLADGRVLVIGGCEAGGDLAFESAEIYDPATRTFRVTGSLSVQRDYESATLLEDGRVLVAGGDVVSGAGGTAELYNPATGRFTPTGKMVDPHGGGAAVRLRDGKVLIAGGSEAAAELYDPATGKFGATGQMPAPLLGLVQGVLLADGRVLLIGSDETGNQTILEIYDPAAATFSAAGTLAVNRAGFAGLALLPNGKVMIAGSDPDSTVDIFDPATATLAPGPKMARPLEVFTCTPLADGRILFLGIVIGEKQPQYGSAPRTGGDVLFDRRPSTDRPAIRPFMTGPFNITGELYDPSTGRFSYLGHLNVQRSGFGASLLLDGRVFIVGGSSDTAELFDPATGKFRLNNK